MELFISLCTQSTHFCTALILFGKYLERLGNAVPMSKLLFLPLRLRERECINQLTHQVSAEGQLPVSVCCRGGMICHVI